MFQSIYQHNENFVIWSGQHWAWIIFAVLSTAFWICLGRRAASPEQQARIGFYMGMVGVASWLFAEGMMFWQGGWVWMSVLPLHLCYFLHFLLPFMVLRRAYAAFDIIYPIVMSGCLLALFTPDLKNGFPQFHNIRYFLVHIALVQSVLYCILVYGFRPSFSGIFKCLAFFAVYGLMVTPFNLWLDTNFMYLRKRPPGTLLDLFADGWPYYLGGSLLCIVLFFVVWLPFGLMAWFGRKKQRDL
jgi:hypothetical integral membrane protein (TIGR02206 family)